MLILLLANLSLHHYCIHNSDSVFRHIGLYDECTEEQELYAWWMECPGGACEYVEEFAFGASLVWCRIANIWYLHIIDLHHVATYTICR